MTNMGVTELGSRGGEKIMEVRVKLAKDELPFVDKISHTIQTSVCSTRKDFLSKQLWLQTVQNTRPDFDQQQTSFKGEDVCHVAMTTSCLLPDVPSDCSTQIATPLSTAELPSITTYAAGRPCSHRVDDCITFIRLSPWSRLLRIHEDVTLRKREQAGKDPGDFLTPAVRSSVRWCFESGITSPDVRNVDKRVVMWRTTKV